MRNFAVSAFVAQWKSVGLRSQMLWVRSPSEAYFLEEGKSAFLSFLNFVCRRFFSF